MIINVNESILKDAIENLKKNTKFVVINNNLFSIENIDTMINVKTNEETYLNGLHDETRFLFTYKNSSLKNNVVKIVFPHEDTTCTSFVELCKFISEDEADKILLKADEIASEKCKTLHRTPSVRETDEIFYNEVLIYISSKINENDKVGTTDDFTSKFEMYKEKQQEKNDATIALMKEFYDLILKIKLND